MSALTARKLVRLPPGLLLAVGLFLVSTRALAADSQIRPFVGATFGGSTTFVDWEHAAGNANIVYGISAARLGEVFGFDLDIADAPGFFQTDSHLVLSSRVTTLTGNIVVAAPRRLTQYSLRPYVIGGAGLMRVRSQDVFSALPVAEILPGMDVGGGALGFLTDRVGISWELRRFQSLGGTSQDGGTSIGRQQLSFWRATMAIVYRY
jgi:hypothetical protein